MKRIIALALALMLAFAFGVQTFAHEDSDIACTDHQFVEESYDDGYFWYWRIWCPNCGHTYEYESGYYR